MKSLLRIFTVLFIFRLFYSCENAGLLPSETETPGADGSETGDTADAAAAVPIHKPSGISFTDLDKSAGELRGTITINKAADESDITHYRLYWGKYSFLPLGWYFAEFEAAGSDLTYELENDTELPAEIGYILAVSKNDAGEMGTGVSIEIIDTDLPLTPPVNRAAGISFSDTDTAFGTVGGTVNITRAVDESDITHYFLYNSENSLDTDGVLLAELEATGTDLSYTIPDGTAVSGLLNCYTVFTRNYDGMMTSGRSAEIIDNYPPFDVTVYDVQDESSAQHPQQGADVTLSGLVVTAVSEDGRHLWAQEPAGPYAYGGICIYSSSAEGLSIPVGSEITVTGKYQEFYELTQVVLSEYTITDTGCTLPIPAAVTPAQIRTGSPDAEQYESVLVSVDNVTVLEPLADTLDPGEFVVTDDLIVNELLYASAPAAGTIFTNLTGILYWDYTEAENVSNFKLLPRNAADMVQ